MPKDKSKLANVVIARNAYSWQYGGAEQFAYNLAWTLENRGVHTRVVSRVPELLAHCRRKRIKTFRNIWFQNQTRRRWMVVYYVLMPLLVGQYAWVLMRDRADLYIASSRDDQVFGTIAARLVGCPVVWFDHADMKVITGHSFHLLSRLYYWSLQRADRVIMTSQAEHAKVSQFVPESMQSNFVDITNGAMVGEGKPLDRPDGAKIVAYIGRLEKDKGVLDLAEAATGVVKAVPQAQFWLAGKGPYEAELRRSLEKLGVADHFRFLGHLDNVRDLLMSADVFVYPTHHDAAPLAPLEAIIAGVPVVASDIGGIPEMLPAQASLLVPPKSPAKLGEALADLLSNDKRRETMAREAKQAGKTRTFDYVVDHQYLPLFSSVIKEAS